MSSTITRRIILIICLILAFSALALALFYTPPASSPAAALQQEDGPPYTVKSYQGYVAVFTDDEDTPIEITGTRVELLPLQDQLELAEGISVSSKEALSALLEDYGS